MHLFARACALTPFGDHDSAYHVVATVGLLIDSANASCLPLPFSCSGRGGGRRMLSMRCWTAGSPLPLLLYITVVSPSPTCTIVSSHKTLNRAERAQGDRHHAALREVKKQERDAVAGGKQPYFLKKSARKQMSIEQRCG